jgi:hydroxymethylbilane synthase
LLINKDAVDLSHPVPVRAGARVGASSLRRMALLRQHAPWASAVPLRGNVPTRLSKLANREYEAIILAAAGMVRLGLDLSAFHVVALNPLVWVPAPGQGTIAVQCRENDAITREALAVIDHAETRRQVETERTLLRAFEGGCSSPFGAYLPKDGTRLQAGLERDGRWSLGSFELATKNPLTLEHANRLLLDFPRLESHAPLTEDC